MESVTSVEVEYHNQKHTLHCIHTPTFFVMDPSHIADPRDVKARNFKRADYDPATKNVTYYRRGKVVRVYNEATDPQRIAACPWLHKTPLIKDSAIDGSIISDYTYFRKQRDAYRKSLTYALYQAGLDRKVVSQTVRDAIKDFERQIKQQRGVDITVNLPTPAEDMEIVEHLRQRAFRQAQSKMPCTA